MEERHKTAIQNNMVQLGKDLTINAHFLTYFRPANILTADLCQTIMSKTGSRAKASAFLEIISKRGPQAMRVFIIACIETGVKHLAKKLDPNIAKEELSKTENMAGEDQSEPPRIYCQPTDPTVTPSSSVQEGINCASVIKPFDEADSGLRKYLTNEEAYKMTSNPRGLAVIINIMFYNSFQVEFRQNSEYDVDKLKTLFEHLHFVPVVHENLTASEIKSIVTETKNTIQPSHDAFVLCVMSHGKEGKVIDTDGEEVDIQHDIIDQFNAENCPLLRHKPKIFISETSNIRDNITTGENCPGGPAMCLDSGLDKLSLYDTDNKPVLLNIQADMVYVCSTGQGNTAMRNKEGVSYFIDAIDEIFKRFCCTEHIMDLLMKVRQTVIEKRGQEESTNIPHEQTTLLKKCFFFPGYKPHSSVEESDPHVEANIAS